MKGIILHGGHGTRLRPLTHTGPKQLLPIANKPMSQYCIESLKDSGIKDIVLVVGSDSEKVKEYYKHGEDYDVNISYIEQDSPRGIAHAISLCQNFIDNDDFIVFLGDNFINSGIKNFVNDFKSSNCDAMLLLCEVNNPEQFGIAYLNGEKISKMIEKPKNPQSNLAITGIYFLTPKIFEKIKKLKPSWRNELEIVDALQMILDDNGKILHKIINGFWKDTGTPNDIIDANKIILENISHEQNGVIEDNSEIIGKFTMGKNSILRNNCKIIGPVIIGENCIIENAIIGSNVSVGDNSNISNCNIENSIVMEDCIINSNITIADSIIAHKSQILSQNIISDKKKFLLGEGTKISF